MRFLSKRTAGFSLLELMVVVAIIGVLATVAVPRFNIFRARARQGEAKANLGVIFTLQEAFKIDKEQYYDGDSSTWGGSPMDGRANREGYQGAGASDCGQNKLGFRLANCSAARYAYWISAADESNFLVIAHGMSDSDKRIFPGCRGTSGQQRAVHDSDSPDEKKCSLSTDITTGSVYTSYTRWAGNQLSAGAGQTGGDAFCLDQKRTVDNFRDIVSDPACTN